MEEMGVSSWTEPSEGARPWEARGHGHAARWGPTMPLTPAYSPVCVCSGRHAGTPQGRPGCVLRGLPQREEEKWEASRKANAPQWAAASPRLLQGWPAALSVGLDLITPAPAPVPCRLSAGRCLGCAGQDHCHTLSRSLRECTQCSRALWEWPQLLITVMIFFLSDSKVLLIIMDYLYTLVLIAPALCHQPSSAYLSG